ncbi:hypothetical protein R2362_06430 [Mycobacteroides chelonae]|nr:hypothetical protein [Mycobacteroides chelonae]
MRASAHLANPAAIVLQNIHYVIDYMADTTAYRKVSQEVRQQ